jgi:hypothetical protein
LTKVVLAENVHPFEKDAHNKRAGYNHGPDPQTVKVHIDIPALSISLPSLTGSAAKLSKVDQA